MMNDEPLNLLSNKSPETARSSQVSPTMTDEERRMALSALFNSLSHLARNNQHNQQPTLEQHYREFDSNQKLNHDHQMLLTSVAPSTSMPEPLSLSNSLQSAIMAAMIQQQQQQPQQLQLANGHPQPNQHQLIQCQYSQPSKDTQQSIESPQLFVDKLESNQPSQSLLAIPPTTQLAYQQSNQQVAPHPPVNQQQPQQQQRINYCTICNKELCNKYFMKTHMLKMHQINLELEQPSSDQEREGEGFETADGSISGGDEETEQTGASELNESDDNKPNQSKPHEAGSSTQQLKRSSKTAGSKNSKSSAGKAATSVMNGFAGNAMGGVVCDICNKELCSKYFLKVHKQNTHGITTDQFQDTSHFMYPFAAGLAVQNPFLNANASRFVPTNPLALLTANSMLQQHQHQHHHQHHQQQQQQLDMHPLHQNNPIDCSSDPIKGFYPPSAKKARLSQMNQPLEQPFVIKSEQFGSTVHLEPGQQHLDSLLSTVGCHSIGDSTYRLNGGQPFGSAVAPKQTLPHTQQQQQHQQHQHQNLGTQSQLIGQAAMMDAMSPMAANPLSLLMCFGSMGPVCTPSGFSPTMIVDAILRSQHLFNRHSSSTKDRNNNNNVGSPGTSSKKGSSHQDSSGEPAATSKVAPTTTTTTTTTTSASSSSTTSGRYFSHYTEACPMCDRRFKSIKWLKTHMMNDHKQEIGAYMQMMMQYFYGDKSQQMAVAAAATAAAAAAHGMDPQLTIGANIGQHRT